MSSLQVPPHFFTQKSALATSRTQRMSYVTRCDDFFFWFFLACIRSHGTATSTTSSLSLRLDPTVCEFPSHLVTVLRECCLLVLNAVTSTPQWIRQPEAAWGFDVPVARMRASAMQNYFKITNLLCEWHTGSCGGFFSPSDRKKQKSHVHPLSPWYSLTSARPNCFCVVLIFYLVWMCAAGASSCPPYKCLRTFLHKSLLYHLSDACLFVS